MLVSIIVFFIMFSVIVISHEFGHYAIARRNGIRVVEFDVGVGPTIFHKKIGETDFCWKPIPLGGACIFDGYTDLPETDGVEQKEGAALDEHAYPNASVFARLATSFGGPLMNILLGFVFALVVVAFTGTDLPNIYGIMEGSAAQEAGIEPGDTIYSINGEHVHVYREVQLFSMVNYGEPLKIVYIRDGEKHEVTLTPRYDEGAGRYYIGLLGSGEFIRTGPLQTFQYAYYEALYWVRASIKSLALIPRGHFEMDNLAGPVGVVKVVDDTYTSAKPYGLPTVVLSFLELSTLLSINLGIMNLLPIPALDGGKIVLLVVELIRGRKLPPEKEGYITLAGAIAIIVLTIVVMFNDITRFFR